MNLLFEELEPRLLSPKLWKGFAPPIGSAFPATASGNPVVGLFDDFVGFGRSGAAASGVAYYTSNGIGYKAFEDDDGSIQAAVPTTTPAVDMNGVGVIAMTAGDTDNDDVVIQAGGNQNSTMVPFNVIQASAKELVFECRFKYSTIVAGTTDFFIGLGGTGMAANNGWLADDSAAWADNNFLGFSRTLETGTSGLNLVYDRVGGTTATRTGLHTLVADKYLKAGFRFNAQRKTLGVYIDGELVDTVPTSATGATPWPTLYMNFLAGIKYQQTTQDVLYVDWWACAQMA